jgi:hypothetical protein
LFATNRPVFSQRDDSLPHYGRTGEVIDILGTDQTGIVFGNGNHRDCAACRDGSSTASLFLYCISMAARGRAWSG